MATKIISVGCQLRSRIIVSKLFSSQGLKNIFHQNSRLLSSDALEMKIKASENAENLLQLVQDHHLSGNQASLSLSRVAQLQNTAEINTFTSNPIFTDLCSTIEKEKFNISTESLVLSLINLCRIQSEPNFLLIQGLIAECRRRLRVMQIRHLIFMITNHSKLSELNFTYIDDLLNETVAVIEVRLKDIFEVKNLVQLLVYSPLVSKSLPSSIQRHIISNIDYFSFSDLTQFCKAMLVNKFPKGELVKAMSMKMGSIKEEWSVHQILQVLQCFAGMSFNDRGVVIDITMFLHSQIKTCSLPEVLKILNVYSSLRILNNELLSEVEKLVFDQIGNMSFRDLRCVLQAFFVLQFVPNEDFVNAVTKEMVEAWSDLKPYLQLELAWAMMGLNKLPKELLEEVLKLNASDFSSALSLKHQHLLTHAKMESSSVQLESLSNVHSPMNVDVKLRPLQLSVKKILDDVINERFIATNTLTPIGHVIDFQLILDSEQKLVDNAQSGNDITRLAILVHGPTNYLQGSDKFVGPVVLRRKQLKALGYNLIEIGYREWYTMTTETDKKKFLKQKLDIKM